MLKILFSLHVLALSMAGCCFAVEKSESFDEANLYVQAGPGSFNHQALELLYADTLDSEKVTFCGTPLSAMKNACKDSHLAFVAVTNNTVPGTYVEETVDALKHYQIDKVVAIVRMKIEMSLLRKEDDFQKKESLTRIVSHPAALKQINNWKAAHTGLEEVAEHLGTAEAARRLSNGEFDRNTGVIGSKKLASVYPQLVVAETAIQDREDNYTTFILIEVSKRPHVVSEAVAKQQIDSALAPSEVSFQDDPAFFQVYDERSQ